MKDIDTWLREDAARGVADPGFDRRVLRALPRPAASRARWLRPALVMGSAVAGSVLAIAFAPPLGSPAAAIADLFAGGSLPPAAWAAFALAGALLVSSLVVAFDTE